MKRFSGFERGMGIGGWLTNYKRFNVLPVERRLKITEGDMEHFRTYITKNDVLYIKELGLDHIRLGFDQIVLEETPYVYRTEIFEIIKEFVDNCCECGLNVILNLHKAIGNYCDIPEETSLMESEELQNRFISLWVELEKYFSDYPNVVFELLNEVRDVEADLWNHLAEKTITELRKHNPIRKLIVGTTHWNSCNKLKDLRLYDDENVIYTFHTYAPVEFTHQRGVLQANTLYYNRALAYPCDDIERYKGFHRLFDPNTTMYNDLKAMDKEYIRKTLQPAIDFVKEHPDKILWCGEFGTIRHADITSRENWMRDVISILIENEIPYSVWNYLSTPNDGNRFSLVDDDERKILSEFFRKIIIDFLVSSYKFLNAVKC